ncbi:phosphotriesterase family protein [Pseudonocardia acaciae]|uniref:phosphotriesterase family protein n=1 Tax=Pseudonocardia acaciae TaxID=551276 RepID=UPI000491600E|nr:phosphotriesterase [Pseudonocardia acaciae]
MTRAVRTVCGDIEPARLGTCDAHDHVFLTSAALPGHELTDPRAAEAELRAFAEAGGASVVQWSPFGTGRGGDWLAELSRSTGVHLVAATGLHQARHYRPDTIPEEPAQLFVDELVHGMRLDGPPGAPPTRARAGLIKVAGSFHGLDEHARWTMTEAAAAHHATGAPIAVHHEQGTAALDVLDLLCGHLDVPPASVILGHLNRRPDPREQLAAARSGAFLAFDGPSRAHHATDWRLMDTLVALAEAGHADQLMVGADTTTAEARAATGEGPGMPYLLRTLRPRLERELGTEITNRIFVDNPARALATEWRAPVTSPG